MTTLEWLAIANFGAIFALSLSLMLTVRRISSLEHDIRDTITRLDRKVTELETAQRRAFLDLRFVSGKTMISGSNK